MALAGGDLEVAGDAAAVCLRALERGLDQAVGHRVVPVVRVGQELQLWVNKRLVIMRNQCTWNDTSSLR